jgi:hypothetical protein
MKMEFKNKINDYNKEIENIKMKYDADRQELLEVISYINIIYP